MDLIKLNNFIFKAFEKWHKQETWFSFEPIIAINENAAKPHALPTSKN